MDPEAKLKELGLDLPVAPKPVAAYVPSMRTGNLLYVSGQLPTKDGELSKTGQLGKEVDLAEGAAMARQCALNGLAVAKAALGSLSKISQVVRVECFVASTAAFTDQPKVANGASELLVEVLGEKGRHARVAVGVPVLPLGAPVEIAFVFEVSG